MYKISKINGTKCLCFKNKKKYTFNIGIFINIFFDTAHFLVLHYLKKKSRFKVDFHVYWTPH